MAEVKHIYTGEGSPWDTIGDEVPIGSGLTEGSQVHYTDTSTERPWVGVVEDVGGDLLFFGWHEVAPIPAANGVLVSAVPKPEFKGQIGYDTLHNAGVMYVGVTRLVSGSGGPPVTELQWRRVATLGEWLEDEAGP